MPVFERRQALITGAALSADYKAGNPICCAGAEGLGQECDHLQQPDLCQ